MFGGKLREANRTIETQREILSHQEDNIKALKSRGSSDLDRIAELLGQLSKKATKINEIKKQIRDQNEADLLMASMKIIEEIKKGTPKEDPVLVSLQHEQQKLRAQSAAYGRSDWGLQAMGAQGVRYDQR